jgi:hypothetical protein
MIRKLLSVPLAALPLLLTIPIATAQEPGVGSNVSTQSPAAETGGAEGLRPEQTIFYGRINLLREGAKPGEWEIAGRLVRVSDTTKLEFKGRPLRVGNRVDVIGQYEGRYFRADVIRRR